VPLYKDQGIVLGSVKLAEADKIVTILTQGSGKIRAVAKGIRRTSSKFGARLEPLTHVSVMLYRGRSLDTVTQAEIINPFRTLRDELALLSAGETMLETADKVAEEHERNVPLFLLLVRGLRALDLRPTEPAAVAEAFLLRLLSLSGFAPSLSACAVCGNTKVGRFSHSQGGTVCENCHDRDAQRADPESLEWLAALGTVPIEQAGESMPSPRARRAGRVLLYGFAEYHLERRIRSLSSLVRTAASTPSQP
jgi:DNA repair protein RecO (recombination protein O)